MPTKDRADQRLERAKTALLAAGPRKIAGMLDIVQTNAKGRVSWEKAARAAGVDDTMAEPYRGNGVDPDFDQGAGEMSGEYWIIVYRANSVS